MPGISRDGFGCLFRCPGNQGENYRWLERKGFSFNRGAYGRVTEQLLENPGIEALLSKLIIPRVREMFSDRALEYLNTCWQAGTTPDMALLRQYNVRDTAPFLDYNTQFNYVEGWGEFAGVWFEQIEGSPSYLNLAATLLDKETRRQASW